MSHLLRLFFGTVVVSISLWIYWTIWSLSGPVASNIETAVEAGIPDTVAQSTWNQLGILAISLVFALTIGWSLAPQRWREQASTVLAVFIFAFPVAVTAFSPLLGFFGPIFAFCICAAGLVVRSIISDQRSRN